MTNDWARFSQVIIIVHYFISVLLLDFYSILSPLHLEVILCFESEKIMVIHEAWKDIGHCLDMILVSSENSLSLPKKPVKFNPLVPTVPFLGHLETHILTPKQPDASHSSWSQNGARYICTLQKNVKSYVFWLITMNFLPWKSKVFRIVFMQAD